MHLRDCQLAGVDKHNWKCAMQTSGKGEKNIYVTRGYVNREKRTHRQIWTNLNGIRICFNKGNESRCFILKGPNSLNHWNKENEAFIHKHTSKGKRRVMWAAGEQELSAGVCFYMKESKVNP